MAEPETARPKNPSNHGNASLGVAWSEVVRPETAPAGPIAEQEELSAFDIVRWRRANEG
jgi:hypothetical protein